MNNIDLNDRHAIITGGTQGIGFAVASRLLDSGASVTLWDRDNELLAKAIAELDQAGRVATAAIDITDNDAVQQATSQAHEANGRVDILVNNAGIAGPSLKTWEYPLDAWRDVIELDLNAVFYCCRAVLPIMREQNYGRIVNVASIAGKEGNPNASAYSAAKAGVIALTKSISKERVGGRAAASLRPQFRHWIVPLSF